VSCLFFTEKMMIVAITLRFTHYLDALSNKIATVDHTMTLCRHSACRRHNIALRDDRRCQITHRLSSSKSGESRWKYFLRFFHRSLPQNQIDRETRRRNRRRFGDRTGFSRSRDRLSAIADNGHVSYGVFSCFSLFFSTVVHGERTTGYRWRRCLTFSVHFLPRENHLRVGPARNNRRLRKNAKERCVKPSRCRGSSALTSLYPRSVFLFLHWNSLCRFHEISNIYLSLFKFQKCTSSATEKTFIYMGNDSAVSPSSCSVSVLRVFPRERKRSRYRSSIITTLHRFSSTSDRQTWRTKNVPIPLIIPGTPFDRDHFHFVFVVFVRSVENPMSLRSDESSARLGIRPAVKSEPIRAVIRPRRRETGSGGTRAEIGSSTDSLRSKRRGDRQDPPACVPRAAAAFLEGCESSAGWKLLYPDDPFTDNVQVVFLLLLLLLLLLNFLLALAE